MGIFNIKLKTRNGNDIKEKVVFNVYFQLKYVKGLKTTAIYTYRIYYSNKGESRVKDEEAVFEIRDSDGVISKEDLTIKVMLNLIHIISNITKEENLDPDGICFFSTEFTTNNLVWRVLNNVFKKDRSKKIHIAAPEVAQSRMIPDTVDILLNFVILNPNVSFYHIDPNRDSVRYAKSIIVCSQLKGRIEELQMAKQQT